MKFFRGALLFVVCTMWGCVTKADSMNTGPIRVTTESGVVIGEVSDGIRIFKGIPYAAPPVRELRWAPPKPPVKWAGERKAIAFGAACTQPDFSALASAKPVGKALSAKGYDLWVGVPSAPGSSEDCLFLNVWAPSRAGRAPVMVFVHGGGGSGAIPYWDGSAFARDGVILITFNYRNFTLGKFAHPALTKAAGSNEPLARFDLMDQIAALRWVRNNIAEFGGDPGNVTLFGQSAGGAATIQLLTVPAAHGLFDKAIIESGNGWWAPFDQKTYEKIGSLLANQAGLPGAEATVEQLRALPPDAMPWIGSFNFDGRLVPESPTEAIAAGRAADVPLMIGWNSNDGSSLRYGLSEIVENASPAVKAAYAPLGESGDDLAHAMYTDSHVAAPARWIAERTAGGKPTYLYQFSYVRVTDRAKTRGASHGTELPYVFDSWSKFAPTLTLTDEERSVTRTIHSCWVSFAKTGKPHCEGAPEWPRFSSGDDRLMDFDISAKVKQHVRKAQLDAQIATMHDTIAAQKRSLSELANTLEKMLPGAL
jgi:para-nitrobenzyl esterase